MRYTVVWLPAAITELARIWNQSSNRQSVTDSANELDRILPVSPERVGIALGDNDRYVEVGPLACVFDVIPDDRMVHVLEIWLLP